MFDMTRVIVLFLVIAAAASVDAFPSPTRFDKKDEWTGKIVVLKRTGVRYFRVNADGTESDAGILQRMDYPVLKEQNDKLWVRNLSVEGWFPRHEAVLASDAVAYFTKELERMPNEITLLTRRSKAYEIVNDLEKAIADYDQVLMLSPNTSAWHNNRANLLNRKREYDKALADYDIAVQANPNSAIILNNRGNAWFNKRDFDRAMQDYQRAVQLDPTYTLGLVNRANTWREKREYEKALKDVNEAIRLDDKYGVAYSNRAAIWAAKGEKEKALADYNTAVRFDPRLASGFVGRGNCWRDLKDYRRAIDDYEHAMWLDSRSVHAVAYRGEVRMLLREYDKALADFDTALKQDSANIPALGNKALLLASWPDDKRRDGKKALELAEKACELTKSDRGEYLAFLAAAQAELGRFDDAVKTQALALEKPEYARDHGDEGKKRLEIYRAGKPFRQE